MSPTTSRFVLIKTLTLGTPGENYLFMPLDPNTTLKTPEKKEWPLIPEDVYQVELTDLTAEEDEFKGEKKEVFKFEFTIIEEGEHYGRKLWKRGSRVSPLPSATNKAPLTWKVTSAIHKHALTEEEGKKFTIPDMNALIGKQLRVGVVTTAPKPDGKQYNNIEGFYAAKVQLPKFDENKVPKDNQPAKPATPATVVEAAAGIPQFPQDRKPTADEDDGEVEMESVNIDDIPFN